ncbi:hypothetical protein AGDE_12535 [Angomonas deanei]|uniref:Uncharacterized protein n=1 Tax=Angomonas deanei TaxID=59799 RepID=A0A7G2CCD0_9TRYP|nr:hypothetical protein AGDE_12535 [Angomonas deanei]CAD2217169.1 hypothetical protein, conserved [Angomonas deanei]|eukprot:EPY24064.1 hypothetical protein AGDE_12535 [Angomonas deanei]
MSADVINNLHNRCASLEDIIRQQEQTLSAVLGRLRDVEQRFGSEQHAKENTQQQINALLNDRSATAAQIDHLNNALGNQSDRLSNVEAGHQGIQSAVQGVDQKYDAVSRGLENRLQGDIQAVQQRLQASEQATGEAIRSVQGGVQGNTNAIQTVDTNTRASLEGTAAANDGGGSKHAAARRAAGSRHATSAPGGTWRLDQRHSDRQSSDRESSADRSAESKRSSTGAR